MLSAPLNDIAGVLKVHPATLLRNVTGKPAVSWTNPLIQVSQVARRYGCRSPILVRCLHGEDELLTPKEAAALLGITVPSLRWRLSRDEVTPVIKESKGLRCLRFSRCGIEALKAAN